MGLFSYLFSEEKFRMNCPRCGKQLEVPNGLHGKEGQCPLCHENIIYDEGYYHSEDFKTTQNGEIKNVNPARAMRKYKVIKLSDSIISQSINTELLEETLNSYAKDGWRVVASVTADMHKMFGAKMDEMIIILEKGF